jgi:PhnB protein
MTADRRDPGINAVTPYLAVRNARSAIGFYAAAFGARQRLLIEEQDGRIGHATLGIGAAEIYLADEHPEFENVVGPQTLGGTSVTIDIEVDDVDAAVERAVAAGADLVRAPTTPRAASRRARSATRSVMSG